MNGPYQFLLGSGHMGLNAQRIAETHGADCINYVDEHGKLRHWFEAENMGEPFNSRLREAVFADLVAAGILQGEVEA